MAFNQTEQEIIRTGVAAGKTRPEVEQALTNYRTGVIPQKTETRQPGYLSRVGSELSNSFSDLQDTTSRGAELMQEGKPIQGAIMSGLGAAGGFIRGAFSPLTAAVAPTVQKVIQDSGITDNAQVQSVMQGVDKWAKEHPDLATNTKNIVDIATTLVGTKGVTAGVPAIKNTATQVIDKGTEILGGITKTGREGITEATSKALNPANIMQRVARVSKGKQAAFQELTGESIGSYLVNRKIFGDIDQISSKLYELFTSSKGTADKALAKLPGEYKNPAVGSALSALLEKEVKTSSPGAVSRDLGRVRELSKKHLGGGLTMKEINEVKRLYERNIKVDYLRENLTDKIKEATNIDSAIRQFQTTRAAQLGLRDLPAINKETQAAKQLLDDIGAEYAGAAGNNAVSLTDWIILAGGSPSAIGGFLAKKALSSKGVMSKVAEVLSSKMPKKELPAGNIGEPTIDNYLKFLKSTEGQTMTPQPLPVSKESPLPKSTTPRPKAQGAATPNTAVGQPRITDVTKFERAKDLSPADSTIEKKAFDYIIQNEDKILADYKAKHGNVINADNFRPQLTEVGYNGTNAASVQEPVSYLAKRARTEGLKNPGDYVIGTAGGSGVGKTSAGNSITEIKGLTDKAAMVLDSNFSSLDSAHKFIKEVEASGKEFKGVFTYRDAMDALENGIIKRALTNPSEMGRVVPNSVSSGNHIDSFDVVRKLVNEGHQFLFIDNSLGNGKAKLVSLAELEAKVKYPSKAELKALFDTKTKELYQKQTPFTDADGKTHTLTLEQYKSLIR